MNAGFYKYNQLNKALMFATNHSDLDRSEIDIIITARRTVVEYDDRIWNRKNNPDEFDITIGASDSAQVTDLVGIYLMHKLGVKFPGMGVGLYRDDALFTVIGHSNVGIDRSINSVEIL